MNEYGGADELTDGIIGIDHNTNTPVKAPVEEEASTSQGPSEPRRNPMRTCRKQSEMKEAPIIVESTEEEKKVPILQMDQNEEVIEPVTFQDTTSGPWSKWW